MSPPRSRRSDLWSQVAYYSSLGFILPATTLAGYGLGWLIDRWLHTSPILAIVLSLLGAAGGFYDIVVILQKGEAEGLAGQDESDAKSRKK